MTLTVLMAMFFVIFAVCITHYCDKVLHGPRKRFYAWTFVYVILFASIVLGLVFYKPSLGFAYMDGREEICAALLDDFSSQLEKLSDETMPCEKLVRTDIANSLLVKMKDECSEQIPGQILEKWAAMGLIIRDKLASLCEGSTL